MATTGPLGASPSSLYALCDMGSNGIRFSITDLSPNTARSLPTVYQDREGISLYDAQYITGEKGPIPQEIIDNVLAALRRFQIVCSDFGVPATNVRILATEATRTAVNSADYRKQIKNVTGWEVDMLPKEAEGRIGAFGVASSFHEVQGLVMDLGGGSTQITWMMAKDGKVETSPKGSFSFPYGAAALTRELGLVDEQAKPEQARQELAAKMKQQFQEAYRDLDLPETLKYRAEHGGLTLYLSGGGFRGWGYLLMAQHKVKPYPIPIINGFQIEKHNFERIVETKQLAAVSKEQPVFRISKRRAAQVPAVAFLVSILMEALPMIQEIRFCQGGVREGFLYDTLDAKTKAINPLPAATAKHGPSSASQIATLVQAALPGKNHIDRWTPPSVTPGVIRAVADLMYIHSALPKDTRALSALMEPTTGVLASAHGVSHTDRALVALILARRWDSDLAPPYDSIAQRLQATLSKQEAWWCNYIGSVVALIGHVYPSGAIEDDKKRILLEGSWSDGLGKKGLDQGVLLKVTCNDGDVMTCPSIINDVIEGVEKVGRKKNRIGGKEFGYGVVVRVDLERVERL